MHDQKHKANKGKMGTATSCIPFSPEMGASSLISKLTGTAQIIINKIDVRKSTEENRREVETK